MPALAKRRWTTGLTFGVLGGAACAAPVAEYAVRWDPSKGGPQTAVAALALLDSGAAETDHFEIRYGKAAGGPTMPVGVTVIVRERFRSNKPRFELTYKVRSDGPLPVTSGLSPGNCPAGAGGDPPKDELDVAFTGVTSFSRVHSRSCSVESKTARPPVPEDLRVTYAPCATRMTRLKVGRLKLEEWHLPGGRVALEASRTGPDTAAELDAFRRDVVRPLVEVQRVTPLLESKTELGSECS